MLLTSGNFMFSDFTYIYIFLLQKVVGGRGRGAPLPAPPPVYTALKHQGDAKEIFALLKNNLLKL